MKAPPKRRLHRLNHISALLCPSIRVLLAATGAATTGTGASTCAGASASATTTGASRMGCVIPISCQDVEGIGSAISVDVIAIESNYSLPPAMRHKRIYVFDFRVKCFKTLYELFYVGLFKIQLSLVAVWNYTSFCELFPVSQFLQIYIVRQFHIPIVVLKKLKPEHITIVCLHECTILFWEVLLHPGAGFNRRSTEMVDALLGKQVAVIPRLIRIHKKWVQPASSRLRGMNTAEIVSQEDARIVVPN